MRSANSWVGFCFNFGVVLLFNPVSTYLAVTYPSYTASVFGGNPFARATYGDASPLLVSTLQLILAHVLILGISRAPCIIKLGVGGARSLLGGLAILFIPIPFVLYFVGHVIALGIPCLFLRQFGRRIRKASKRVTQSL